MSRLDGKVALISGGARGIGETTARVMAEAGAAGIVITDLDDEPGRAVAASISEQGGDCVFFRHDVTSESDWERVIAAAVERFGGLDVLVNNAGIVFYQLIEETTLEAWQRITRVNLDGVFLGTKHGIRAMKQRPEERGSASIVNLSSVAGLVGAAGGGAYHMTKGGVRLFTKCAAVECAEQGYPIRVNSIHPGLIETRMADRVIEDSVALGRISGSDEEVAALKSGLHPMGRLGRPEEVARGILYLASDDASFVTGSELVVDGGLTAR